MNDDAELLRRYAVDRSEDAFTELIRRHVDLVYSAALRLVNGDVHRAQDVTQQVFAELARQAGRLSSHPALIGWLYTATRRMALRIVRTEQRRAAREQEAHTMNDLLRESSPEADWGHLGPVLEDAMHELEEKDRVAVLLRFFKSKSLKEVGAELGLSDNAARMRVERALDKLRARLAQKGVISTTAVLGAMLAANTVSAAPTGFVAALAGASLAGAGAGGGTALTILKTMSMTKLQIGVAAIAIAGAGTAVVVEQQTIRELRHENEVLQQQVVAMAPMKPQSEPLTELPEQANEAQRLPDDQLELLRLRAEVTALRQRTNELAQARPAPAGAPGFRSPFVKMGNDYVDPVTGQIYSGPALSNYLADPEGFRERQRASETAALEERKVAFERAYRENPDQTVDANDNTHLHIAAYRGDLERVQRLLQINPRANVNLRNKEGETPLYECLEGRTRSAKEKLLLLLQHGADPNIPDNNGKTPLQLAIERNRIEEANLLRHWGARE